MKKYECQIRQSHVMEVRGEAKDAEEFLLYVNDLVTNQPKVEILLPQNPEGVQITDDPDNPPYTVVIEYLSMIHLDRQFIAVVDGTLEEVTPNIKIST